ncbi:MAG: alpha/beta fold hydrolase [Janthinobacterium lividum]
MTMKTIPTGLGPIAYDDQGETGQSVALLWPSLFSDHRMWEAQIGPLRAAGWRTLALDPPGHGASPGPGRLFTMDECTAVAVTLIDALPADVPVVMLGTSWGGMVAPRVAHARPSRLAGLVMTNTTAEAPDLKTRLTAKLLTVMLRIPAIDDRVDTMLLSMQLSELTRSENPEIGRTYAARFRSYRRKPFIQAVDSVLVRRDAFLDKLGEVTTPALVLSGADDTILPTAMNRRIADRMPNAEAIEIEGAAHLVPVERPEQTNALMLDRMNRWIGAKR